MTRTLLALGATALFIVGCTTPAAATQPPVVGNPPSISEGPITDRCRTWHAAPACHSNPNPPFIVVTRPGRLVPAMHITARPTAPKPRAHSCS